jgi:hypothetical protein
MKIPSSAKQIAIEFGVRQLYPNWVFDTTVNLLFHILYWILKRHFDKLNQGINGVANLILKS